MTEREADQKVKSLYGPHVYAWDRSAHRSTADSPFSRFYVGDPNGPWANGNTWEKAFANLRNKKPSVAHAKHGDC